VTIPSDTAMPKTGSAFTDFLLEGWTAKDVINLFESRANPARGLANMVGLAYSKIIDGAGFIAGEAWAGYKYIDPVGGLLLETGARHVGQEYVLPSMEYVGERIPESVKEGYKAYHDTTTPYERTLVEVFAGEGTGTLAAKGVCKVVDAVASKVLKPEIPNLGKLPVVTGKSSVPEFELNGAFKKESMPWNNNEFKPAGATMLYDGKSKVDFGLNSKPYFDNINSYYHKILYENAHHLDDFDIYNFGNLPKKYSETFAAHRYSSYELTSNTIVYRAGSKDSPLGEYFSLEKPISEIQVRTDKAIKHTWDDGVSSKIDTIHAIEIPAGTIIHVGSVSTQGGIYLGGTKQIIIQEPWNIKGVKIVKSYPINRGSKSNE